MWSHVKGGVFISARRHGQAGEDMSCEETHVSTRRAHASVANSWCHCLGLRHRGKPVSCKDGEYWQKLKLNATPRDSYALSAYTATSGSSTGSPKRPVHSPFARNKTLVSGTVHILFHPQQVTNHNFREMQTVSYAAVNRKCTESKTNFVLLVLLSLKWDYNFLATSESYGITLIILLFSVQPPVL